jgi:hypothetical protein
MDHFFLRTWEVRFSCKGPGVWQASRNCFSRNAGDSSLLRKGLTTTACILEDVGKYMTYTALPSDKLEIRESINQSQIKTNMYRKKSTPAYPRNKICIHVVSSVY